jgi:putative YphP/YqiW family bacilliredoxin
MSANIPGFRTANSGYPQEITNPMREEMVAMGAEELRTPDEVDMALRAQEGTALVVVNSVCGCAAGQCRPGVALSLQNGVKPDKIYTFFAGVDREATEKARSFFKGFVPSSPQVALLKDGKVVTMLERHNIENHTAEQVAEALRQAYAEHCG